MVTSLKVLWRTKMAKTKVDKNGTHCFDCGCLMVKVLARTFDTRNGQRNTEMRCQNPGCSFGRINIGGQIALEELNRIGCD